MKKITQLIFISFLFTFCSSQIYAQRFNRGVDEDNKVVFVPKGEWLVGTTFSHRSYNLNNYNLSGLLNIAGEAYTFNLSPYVSYFFADNIGAGARFSYKRSKLSLDKLDLQLAEEMKLNVSDIQNIQHSYIGSAIIRSYISINKNARFGLFNELSLSAGGGQGKFVNSSGEEIKGTYHNTLQFAIGMSPGLTAFINNNIAAEVSVGLLGFNFKKINQITNQVYESSYRQSSADFKIDIFAINLSLSFFI